MGIVSTVRLGEDVRVVRGPHTGAYGKRATVVNRRRLGNKITLTLRLAHAGVFVTNVALEDVEPAGASTAEAVALLDAQQLAVALHEALKDFQETFGPLATSELATIEALIRHGWREEET